LEREGLAGELVGVARAVELLVVAARELRYAPQPLGKGQAGQHVQGHHGVVLDDLALGVVRSPS
jgi:hypothetical protein